jgi:hypothetical protein
MLPTITGNQRSGNHLGLARSGFGQLVVVIREWQRSLRSERGSTASLTGLIGVCRDRLLRPAFDFADDILMAKDKFTRIIEKSRAIQPKKGKKTDF